MNTTNFTTTLVVDQTPKEVFNAINNVRGWWSEEIEGNTERVNSEFKYQYNDVHRCKIKITESIPEQKVGWHVLDNYFKFTKDSSEWKDTKIQFTVSRKGDKTQMIFTHVGLVPEVECYEVCRDAWTTYIQRSLHSLITTGKGHPNGKDKPQTKHEKELSSENRLQ